MPMPTEKSSFLSRLLGKSDIYVDGQLYMRRWRLIHVRWFGLRVQRILRSDAGRELHDHPFNFVSLILKGGYWEHIDDGSRTWYGPGSLVKRKAETLRRLELPHEMKRVVYKSMACDDDDPNEMMSVEQEAWTLVIRGPYFREWGFSTDKGWVRWQDHKPAVDGYSYQTP